MGRPRSTAGTIATTERLLVPASKEFARRGFDGARLEDIARAAGISRPSLLYHYGSKHALYSAVIRSVFADLAAALQERLAGRGEFPERFDRVLSAFLDFMQTNDDAPRLILREILDGRGPGQDLLLEAGIPVLEMVERFVRIEGKEYLPGNVPIRFALLQIVASTFVKTSSGPLEHALWGDVDHTKALATHMFIRRSP